MRRRWRGDLRPGARCSAAGVARASDAPHRDHPDLRHGRRRTLIADTAQQVSPGLVAIVGATGTGKSELSLDLAEAFAARGTAAEIVNADAMQLYRGMDIGTAKLSPADRRGIRHHLLDVLDVTDESSVADYQTRAREAIADIVQRGAQPILVGGSGLYVSSVIYDFRFPGTDPEVRARLEAELEELGTEALYRRLLDSDEAAATAIGRHNGRRLVRALEVIEITGAPFGSGLPDESTYWMPTTVVGLSAPRPTLVERLDKRVIRMWEAGLVAEVESLGDRLERGITASRAIGYSAALAQLHGRMSEAEAITETQATTRRYARRQVGWFRRYPSALWFDHDRGDLPGTVLEGIDIASRAPGDARSPSIDA